VEVRIFLLFMLATSKTQQMALSDLSHTAKNFLDGLRAKAEIPSDPSMPGMYFWLLSSVL